MIWMEADWCDHGQIAGVGETFWHGSLSESQGRWDDVAGACCLVGYGVPDVVNAVNL